MKFDFVNEVRLMAFSKLLYLLLEDLEAHMSGIQQARLLHTILDELYREVGVKLLKPPTNYDLKLKEREVIALWLALRNVDFLTAQDPYMKILLVELNTQTDAYLTNTPIKKRSICVQQLPPSTSESKLLTDGSDTMI